MGFSNWSTAYVVVYNSGSPTEICSRARFRRGRSNRLDGHVRLLHRLATIQRIERLVDRAVLQIHGKQLLSVPVRQEQVLLEDGEAVGHTNALDVHEQLARVEAEELALVIPAPARSPS
jgi:hypothetical protein